MTGFDGIDAYRAGDAADHLTPADDVRDGKNGGRTLVYKLFFIIEKL
jgi:hypothetical protein